MGGKGSGRYAARDRTAEYAARRAAKAGNPADAPHMRRVRRTTRAALPDDGDSPRGGSRINTWWVLAILVGMYALGTYLLTRKERFTPLEDITLLSPTGEQESLRDFLAALTRQTGADFTKVRAQRQADHAEHEELASRVNSLERWRAEQTKAAD